IDRVPCFSVPHHSGFTLIGYADCGKITGLEAAMLQGLGDHLLCPTPDLGSIVLHPSWLRKNLFVLFLRYRNDSPGTVEYDKSRAGGTLIDGSNVVGHFLFPFQDVIAFSIAESTIQNPHYRTL